MIEADIGTVELDAGSFDLVHHRAVLAYVAEREAIFTQTLPAVVPAGWLLAQEPIFHRVDESLILGDTEDRVVARALEAMTQLLEVTGAAASFGLRLPSLFEESGLDSIGQQGTTYVVRGGGAHGDFIWPLLSSLKPFLVDVADISEADIDRAVERLHDQRLSTLTPTLISTWGRQQPKTREELSE